MTEELLIGALFGLTTLRLFGVTCRRVKGPAESRLFIERLGTPATLLFDNLWCIRLCRCRCLGCGSVRLIVGGGYVALEILY